MVKKEDFVKGFASFVFGNSEQPTRQTSFQLLPKKFGRNDY